MRTVALYIPAETLRELGFRALGDCFQEATVRDITMLSCDDSSSLVVNTFVEPVDEALDDSDTIEWWERLTSDATTATYLYKVVASDCPKETPSYREQDLSVETVTPEDHGVTLTLVGSQEALQQELEAYEAADAPVTVRRLTDYEGPQAELDRLTPRQQEVLETAYELGYYEIPRETTADAIAERLDLDRSTVTEHLQRAERNLIATVLSA